MKKGLFILAMWGYIIMGLIQIAALVEGVKAYLGIGTLLAAIVSAIVSYFPFVGPVAGTFGAMHSWDWSWLSAGLLFSWPYALYLVAGFVDAIIER